MPDSTVPKAPNPPSWQEYWGDLAKPAPTLLGLQVRIVVPDSFWRGPLHNLLAAAGRRATAKEVDVFAAECLERWCEEHRNRKTPASSERRKEITRLIPLPCGEPRMHIQADLEGRVSETAFGRVVGTRFGHNAACAKLALREALLLGLKALHKPGTAPIEEQPSDPA